MTLINLGDLAKPATVLIERISEAIGGIARPWQISRIAEAEGKAEIARANTRIKISDLEERALQRMVREEGIRQFNIEKIANDATLQIGHQAKPEDIDIDWIVHFFEKGRLISNEEMQTYWSAMLVCEAESPGRFSKRAISLLASMDRSDIVLFNKFAECVWRLDELIPIVFSFSDKDSGIALSFENLKHLESLGLIHVADPLSPFAATNVKDEANIHFGIETIEISIPNHLKMVETGFVILLLLEGNFSLCVNMTLITIFSKTQ